MDDLSDLLLQERHISGSMRKLCLMKLKYFVQGCAVDEDRTEVPWQVRGFPHSVYFLLQHAASLQCLMLNRQTSQTGHLLMST